MSPRGASRIAALIAVGGLVIGSAFPRLGLAQPLANGDEFVYRAQARDTLIGLSRRLLREPARWVDVQTRNGIANPRRIPLGTEIRIPYAWLRTSAETAAVSNVAGSALLDGKAIEPGAALPQGSLIQTGTDGSVTLNLADGSVITLQKSSALRLETLQQVTGVSGAHDVRLKLESGRVQTVVKPHRDVGRFEIQTPVAVSAVRGTQFRTGFDADAANATDETLEGTVAVSGASSEVPVPAGFGTRVERNGVPLPPVRLLPPPDLTTIAATNTAPQLNVEWPAVAGAARYRAQLAPDPDFHTIIADADPTEPRATLALPPEGKFWLRVRSIDQLGLEGPDATKAITQHVAPPPPVAQRPSPPVLATPVIHRGSVELRWRSTDATRFRVQIARDAAFARPVIDRVVDAQELSIPHLRTGTYYARVQIIEADGGEDPFGPSQSFNVPIPLWLRIAVPVAGAILIGLLA